MLSRLRCAIGWHAAPWVWAERDRAHATLREIVWCAEDSTGCDHCARLARERLENP